MSVEDITCDPIPAVRTRMRRCMMGAMSGPLRADDVADDAAAAIPPDEHVVELTPSRQALVGETTVLAGAADAPAAHRGSLVLPRPCAGAARRRWSRHAGRPASAHRAADGDVAPRRRGAPPRQPRLGTVDPARTAQPDVGGRGVAHAEETPLGYHGRLHGVQLWVAQPERTRHGPPAFEHHDELPEVECGAATATVIVGKLLDVESPARRDTELDRRRSRPTTRTHRRGRRPPSRARRRRAERHRGDRGPRRSRDQLAYLGTGREP